MTLVKVEASVIGLNRFFRFQEPPLWLGVCWGFAEATMFFVVPDLIVTLAALFSFRHAVKQFVVVVVGSIVGGLIMYFLSVGYPGQMIKLVGAVPFVRSTMFDTVRSDFTTDGIWALCKGPLSGIPYKVYAIEAPAYVSPVSFMLVSIPARFERLIVSCAIFTVLGSLFKRLRPQRPSLALGIFVIYWGIVYGFYWTRT
jgi:membrane protein YqaA with SNARE-associated domain